MVMEVRNITVMALLKDLKGRIVGGSSLTSKGQATVPLAVRRKLDLNPGDTVIFEESPDGEVRIRKGQQLDVDFHSALDGTLPALRK